MSGVKKAIGLTCVDTRMMPEATRAAITERFGLEKDKIYIKTDPGIVALIADEEDARQYVIRQIKKLVDLGHVKEIVVCGHQDCKANVVPDEIQREQITRAIGYLKKEWPSLHFTGIFFREDLAQPYGWRPDWL